MRNFSTVLKIAPAFLLAGTIMQAQTTDTVATPRETKIEEVVLIGYGKQKKQDLTGSIASVTAKDFNGSVTSPEQLIQGKTPGVSITGNSGAPGSGSTIRIRGGNSFVTNDPLIVLDGVPQSYDGISGAANALALINPNDIESFDILKDASSAAIYGNRASNGVILITTKKGAAGRLKINFSTIASLSSKMGTVPVLTGDQMRDYMNENSTVTNVYNYLPYLGKFDTNWQDLIYQNAWGTDNNLALSGGISKLPYRLSLGYTEQNGLVRTNEFKRTSLGLNINPKLLNKHLSIDLGFKGTYTDNRFPNDGAIGAAIAMDPTQGIYSGNNNYGGYWEWFLNNSLNTNGTRNPLGLLAQTRDISSIWRMIPSLQMDYKFHFLPDLRWNVNLAYDYSKSNGFREDSGIYAAGFLNHKGSYRAYNQEKKNKLFETYLNYVKKINVINTNVDLMVGHSYQDFLSLNPIATTFFGDGTTSLDPDTYNRDKQKTLLSFYGRAIFTIANKYIITGSMRRDGSSTFWNGNRDHLWGDFPSVAVAWKINEENFMKDISAINTLKLRAGWGKTGQQEVGRDYASFASYALSSGNAQYQFGNQFYHMYRAEQYNPDLIWETTTSKNIGLDFGFANNRISGSIDYFDKQTKDLIAFVPVPAGGLSNYNTKNIGDISNKGYEVNLNLVPVKNDNTVWDLNFNFSKFNPIISSLSDQVAAGYKIEVGNISGVGQNIQVHTVDYNPFAFYVYQQVYDNNGKPINGLYVDRNNDGKINPDDKYMYKSTTPDALLGMSSKLNYKNWDFGFTLRAVLGNYVYNSGAASSSLESVSTNSFIGNVNTSVLENGLTSNQKFSDMFVENASFLRMDNLTVAYNLGNFISSNSNLKITAMAQNVFVVTKYKGLDPEVFGGIDNNFYQRPKVYSLGFNFQF